MIARCPSEPTSPDPHCDSLPWPPTSDVSPHKGYRCAYALHTGHPSCSSIGYRVIRRFGVIKGVCLLQLQLQRCRAVHLVAASLPTRALWAQRGFCDPGCDFTHNPGCHFDLPSDCTVPTPRDVNGILSSCTSCDCGGPSWRRWRSDAEALQRWEPSRWPSRYGDGTDSTNR